MNLLYLHGLSSSGSSPTAQTLRRLLPHDQVVSPDIPIDPLEALALLERVVKEASIDLVIGSSMGGMFAQKLRGYTKILVNPAFHVSELMREQLGVHDFLNPREGPRQFEITVPLCDAYQALETQQFDGLEAQEKDNTYGLFGEKDELVHGSAEFMAHYTHIRFFDGGHRLDERIIRSHLLPMIEEIRRTGWASPSL